MTRNEMKAIIRSLFDECLDIPNDSYIAIDDYDEYILKGIEEAGMQPPETVELLIDPAGQVDFKVVTKWDKNE